MALRIVGSSTTTVDQVTLALTSPTNLPPANVYETGARKKLDYILEVRHAPQFDAAPIERISGRFPPIIRGAKL